MESCLKEITRAARHNRPLAVVMVDADGFKHYNDTYGHLAGDELLRTLAELIRVGRRAADLVARYGGDEFTILLTETDAVGAVLVAEEICQAVPNALILCPITVSMGVSVFPEDGDTSEKLFAQADRRLYEAKRKGGNQVIGPSYPDLGGGAGHETAAV